MELVPSRRGESLNVFAALSLGMLREAIIASAWSLGAQPGLGAWRKLVTVPAREDMIGSLGAASKETQVLVLRSEIGTWRRLATCLALSTASKET